MAESYKGRYLPKHPHKYVGDYRNVIYRSSWELKFMVYCDNNPAVVQWGSEEVVIPYISPIDKRVHRYFIDFFVKVKSHDNQLKTYLIEVKPKKYTKEPVPQTRKTKRYMTEVKNWIVNNSKWQAAKEYCDDRKWEFKILTEEHLKV
jgi:hypothetical protein